MKTPVAFAILVAAAVGIVAGYALGRHQTKSEHPTAAPATRVKHVYTLRQGDVIRVPATATRCEVSSEAGIANLFCDRVGSGGRYQVVFWNDGVDLYDLALPHEPMVPTYTVPAKARPERK